MKDIKLKFKEKLKVPFEKESKETSSTEAVEFVSYFLGCATMIHIMHLQNSNPSIHEPLGKLYPQIEDTLDSVIEKWQGFSGKLITNYKNYDLSEYEGMSPLTYVEDLLKYAQEDRYKAFPKECTPIHNEIDNLENVLAQTIFLLKFNKPI